MAILTPPAGNRTQQATPDPHPPGWCDDALTTFLEKACRNRWATFVNDSDWFRRFIAIDACFLKVLTGWINPSDQLTPFFVLRAHAAFRATVEHAAAGQVAEMFPQSRACLEFAAYGLHIRRNPKLGAIWLARHDDEASMKAAKTEFTVAKIRATLTKAEQHTAGVFNTLYQRAIDFGGHPNERAVTANMRVHHRVHEVEFTQVYLHTDGNELNFALKSAAQTGVCVLEICQLAFPERFELLGVRHEILELRKGL
jgi:hypothetical protein